MSARTTSKVINEMNSGYLSLILLCITLILLASGWKDLYVRSISPTWILLFFVGWLMLVSFQLKLDGIQFNMVYVWVAAFSIGIWIHTRGIVHKLHLLSVGLLLGSFHFLLQEILTTDPIMVVIKPNLDTALFLVLIVILIERRVKEQIACLSIGLLLGDFYFAFVHQAVVPVRFGGPSFQDEWWLSVFAARTLTLVLQSALTGCRVMIRTWLDRKGGWRK
jgi:hypothetical protein